MTRVLITGLSGMTGWELARQAPARGFECVALDRSGLDITIAPDADAALAAVRPDVIINAAAYTGVDAAEADVETATQVNRDGALNLARAANAVGAAMVQISTDYVFDGMATSPYIPDHPMNPVTVYGKTKAEGEDAVRSACDRHAIVRTSWVFSHRGHNFVRTMLSKFGDAAVRVVNDQTGRPTSAADLAGALLTVAGAMSEDRGMSGTWHFANEGACTWYDFARAIFEARGSAAPALVPVGSTEFAAAARRPAYSVLDTSSFSQTFGPEPRHWRDALNETLRLIN